MLWVIPVILLALLFIFYRVIVGRVEPTVNIKAFPRKFPIQKVAIAA